MNMQWLRCARRRRGYLGGSGELNKANLVIVDIQGVDDLLDLGLYAKVAFTRRMRISTRANLDGIEQLRVNAVRAVDNENNLCEP
jgi:hypothetical protein